MFDHFPSTSVRILHAAETRSRTQSVGIVGDSYAMRTV